MKKLALTALVTAIAATGFMSTALAGPRNGDDEWRHRDRSEAHRSHDHDRRDHARNRGDHEWRWGDRRGHWRRHHHGPRIVYRDRFRADYCFIKKVRRYDDWGNPYIKRIRVCR